jgi:large subunit ribosomal protein L10
MAKSRQQKTDLYDQYLEALKTSQAIFLVDLSKLKTTQLTDLKLRLFDIGASFAVIKNTVFTKAYEESPLKDNVFEELSGQTGAFFVPADGDASAIAKIIKEFQTNFELMESKLGFMDGNLLSKEQIQAIADLPTRDELLAKTVYLMAAPVRNLLGVMNGATRDFMNVLNAIKDKGETAS